MMNFINRLSRSWKIYICLVIILAISNAIQVILPAYQAMLPTPDLPAPLLVIALANAGIAIIIYGGLGVIGVKLSRKLGFTEIWDPKVGNRQRFLIPGMVGAALGAFLIASDLLFSQFNGIGRLEHPPFPTSILASLSAGIGEEMFFRLFLSLFGYG